MRSALLMEQAALFLLQTAPPSLRKFAFTMVLAGLKYLSFSQRSLGIRCYMYVLDSSPAWLCPEYMHKPEPQEH